MELRVGPMCLCVAVSVCVCVCVCVCVRVLGMSRPTVTVWHFVSTLARPAVCYRTRHNSCTGAVYCRFVIISIDNITVYYVVGLHYGFPVNLLFPLNFAAPCKPT